MSSYIEVSKHPNNSHNHDKYHYYIGFMIKDRQMVDLLKNVKKLVRRKDFTNTPDSAIHSNKFFIPFCYIGHFDNETLHDYIEHYYKPLSNALSSKIHSFPVELGPSVSSKYKDPFTRVFIELNDLTNTLTKTVIPYFYDQGIEPIYGQQMEKMMPPRIDLMYVRSKTASSQKIDVSVPKKTILINRFCLIRGEAHNRKAGTQSKIEPMFLQDMEQYKFSLLPKLNNAPMNLNKSANNNSKPSNNNFKPSNNNSNPSNNNFKPSNNNSKPANNNSKQSNNNSIKKNNNSKNNQKNRLNNIKKQNKQPNVQNGILNLQFGM